MSDHPIPTLQDYDIRSEGPILPWLKLIARPGKISHYSTLGNRLNLHWTNSPVDGSDPTPFIGTTSVGGRWVGPDTEMIASSIEAFLGSVDYGPRPHTDGSTGRGWRLSNDRCFGYVEFFVEPHWQVFGK